MAAAGNIVGEVGLIVKPVDPGFNAGVQRIIDKIERDAQFKVAADTREAQSALRGIDNQVAGINNSLVQAAVNVGGITAAFYALKGAANQVIGKFSSMFDQLAQAKAGFASILKSPAAGNSLLAEIREFARVSPFVTQELVNYSQQLLGVGVAAEQITPLLQDVGNIISSVGGDTQNIGRVLFTLTQIKSIGRLAGQDAMQLQSALIPITKYLSTYLGKTTAEVKKLQEQGKISSEQVFAAISAQGKNVEGAMDKATRNIAGARAILSDTISIMATNSPELQAIFDDIWNGILKFSTRLSDDDVSTAINNFLKSVGELYESLKPLMKSIAEIGSKAGMAGLKGMTSVLSTFADVISSIPESAMKVLAQFFVGISAVKAPLMLLRYVTSIKSLASGVLQAGVQLTKGTAAIDTHAAAAQRAAGSIRALAVAEAQLGVTINGAKGAGGVKGAMTKDIGPAAAGYLGMGLGAASAIVSDGKGGARDAVGTVAQYAGMGAMVGGPWGAAAGGAVGAFIAIKNASRDAANALKKDSLEAADAWATSIGERFSKKYGDKIDSTSTAEFLKYADNIETQMSIAQKGLDDTKKKLEEFGGVADVLAKRAGGGAAMNIVFGGVEPNQVSSDIDKLISDMTGYSSVLEKMKEDQDALFKNNPEYTKFLDEAASKLALVSAANSDIDPRSMFGADLPGSSRYVTDEERNLVTGQISPRNTEQVMTLMRGLVPLGLTLNDLVSHTSDELIAMVTSFRELPDSIRDSLKATNEWLTRLKDAKVVSETMWQPYQDKIGAVISYNKALTSSLDAQTKAAYNLKDANAQLAAESETYAIREQVYNRYIADFGDTKATRAKANELAERAYAVALRFRAEAEDAANATALFANENINKERIDQLLKISDITDTLENRQVIIDIATKNIDTVLADMERVNQAIIDIGQSKISGPEKNDLLTQDKAQLAALQRMMDDILAGKYNDQFSAEAKAAIDKRDYEKNQQEAKRLAEEAARKAEQWANAVQSATESLSNSIETAAKAIKSAADSWIGSIKERTQYEQAVSTGRLTRNANRQVADIAELTSGISNLQGRGVPQSVLDALGINNVSDTRQLRKLVNSSDADLAALVATVSALDTGATSLAISQEDKRTRDNITQGIIDAAKALDITLSKDQAAGISNQFNIVPGTNAEEIALQILNILTSGRISA